MANDFEGMSPSERWDHKRRRQMVQQVCLGMKPQEMMHIMKDAGCWEETDTRKMRELARDAVIMVKALQDAKNDPERLARVRASLEEAYQRYAALHLERYGV